jgi:hypothetical protein
MAPVKFEKELKKRLRSREARPSEDAWDRIVERLDAEGPEHRRKPRWWIGLAAASIALLVSLVFFWEQPELLPVTDPLVETPEAQRVVPGNKQEVQSLDLVPERDQAPVSLAPETEKPDPSEPREVSEPATFKAAGTQVATASPGTLSPLEEAGGIQELTTSPIDGAYQKVVAMENSKASVGDAHIDSLLREAMQALATEEGSGNQSSVDPAILLAQAEDELDQTFREQILEKLKTEYTRIRNSVADRSKQP